MPRRSLAVAFALVAAHAPAAEKPSPEAVAFFETKVRPLLAEHCYSCHGPKKQNAGLRLDTAAAIKTGSDVGPVIVPGDAGKSSLVKAVRRQGDAPMPPDKPLPPQAVAVLAEWVTTGAALPDDQAVRPAGPDPRAHWAFQPVRDPAPPAVKHAARVANPVDRFVLAKLEEKGLSLAPPADRRTLLRRASFDLVGLPPAADAVEAFERDRSPDAWAKAVDRLLASPQYGERWGRHWLDLARYADNKGYVFNEDRSYPYAYTYRDYVVRAFNADTPYDRFILEQLAADKLNPADKGTLAALGFLTVGRRFSNNVHDITDDRIDVVTRGLMGLTAACARCHDHKFDPVPARDYYSLYGVFRSSVEPKELPRIGDPPPGPEADKFAAELAKKEAAVTAVVAERLAARVAAVRTPDAVTAYVRACFELRNKPGGAIGPYVREKDLNGSVLSRWRQFLDAELKARSPVFVPLAALAAAPEKNYPAMLAQFGVDPNLPADPDVLRALRDAKPATLKDAVTVVGKLIAAPPPGASAALARPLGAGGPTDLKADDLEKVQTVADRNAVAKARADLAKFLAASPLAPPRAMVVEDGPRFASYVFLRGSPENRGPAAPPQFLECLSGPDRKPFADGSGRLDLARAIAGPTNPLTARVWVNRVWGHHFGRHLVATPSDFGVRSDPPTHPELLDWLATRFVQGGWSTKALHRLVLLSATYQQSSVPSASAAADPENRLYGRQTRRRLDFEALRDSVLYAAGTLDPAVGGRAVDLFKAPFPRRRTIYGFVDRQNVPTTFRAFDVATADQHSPQRFETTVPQQALFLLNSPFLTEQAKALAARPDVRAAADPGERVTRLYRVALGRTPRPDEQAVAAAFVAPPGHWARRLAAAKEPFGRWEQLAQVLLLSNEFAFAD